MLVELADSLLGVKVRAGDALLMESRAQLLVEKLPGRAALAHRAQIAGLEIFLQQFVSLQFLLIGLKDLMKFFLTFHMEFYFNLYQSLDPTLL